MKADTAKIKILFAVGRFSVGGAEKFLVHQFNTIDRERYEPKLITIFSEQKDSFIEHVRMDRCFNFSSTFDLAAFGGLYTYMRHERFDVVVTHLFTANLLVRFAAILCRVPTIIGYEHNIYPNKRYWQRAADWVLALWTDVIICDSEVARTFTARQERIPLHKLKTMFIPPLLDKREPRPQEDVRRRLGIKMSDRVILTVSRLVSDKGHTHLIDAAKRVLARVSGVVFVIVGWGPLEGELKEKAEKLGIADRMILPGRMDIQDVLPLADLYVDPAVSTDLPVAIMEAMREGRGIVATSVGEIPLFVVNEETGLIVQPGDDAALAEAIEKMLQRDELRKLYGDAARKKVAEYSLENYMDSFEKLIKDLHAGKHR